MRRKNGKQMSTNMQCLITAIGFIILALLFFPAKKDSEEIVDNGQAVVEVSPAPVEAETIID